MKPKYYLTERGAKNFEKKVQAFWQNLTTRISVEIDPTFKNRYFVEVRHPSKYGQWVRCGYFSKRAKPANFDAI